MKKSFTIIDEIGLHARPVSILVGAASRFQNEINIEYKGKKVTLKSIIAVMSLAVPYNETVEIEVIGDCSEDVMSELEETMIRNEII